VSKIADQHYLLTDQYRDATNLDARVRLHVLFSANKYGWNRWYFDQLDLPSHARILELGCGPGHLWRDNLDRTPANWDVTLSDFSAGMLRQAEEKLRQHKHPFHYQVIDAQSIPFDDGAFDAVIANHMLYHVPGRSKALSEMRRVLKHSGRAYIATNGDDHLRELHDLMQRFDPNVDFGWGKRSYEIFSLSSSGEELSRLFANITIHRYTDALIVTEAEPLVDYILSMTTIESAKKRRVELMRFVEHELSTRGAIHIAKDSGLFVCLAT
jgi:ubiquinone/menaquinone biosynthesis C-methylase UbiE